MAKSIMFDDYYKMPQREIELQNNFMTEKDEEGRKELLRQMYSMRGIYKNEEGILSSNEAAFIRYVLQAFTMIYVKGSVAFYNYSRHCYEYVDEADYLTFFKTLLDDINSSIWSTKLEYRYKTRFKREITPRLKEWSMPAGWVAFVNGCLNIDDGAFYPGDHPGIHSFSNTGYVYDESAKATEFIKFIEDVFGGDHDLIKVVQEVMGYTLCYGSNPMQAIILLCGGGRNGKGVLTNILMKMHGESNCSALSVAQVSSQFGVAPMYDKVINISSENNENISTDTSILKTMSGNDLVMAERKYMDPIPVRIYTKLIISTNSITFKDSSKGFQERLIPIPFKFTYVNNPQGPMQKQRDNELEEKLSKELPGIFNWCLEGYNRLKKNNFRITKSEAVEKERERIVATSNPVQLFTKENIIFGSKLQVRKPDVYKRYKEWVGNNGVNAGIYQSAQRFYDKFDSILQEHALSSGTKRIHGFDYYCGIGLK